MNSWIVPGIVFVISILLLIWIAYLIFGYPDFLYTDTTDKVSDILDKSFTYLFVLILVTTFNASLLNYPIQEYKSVIKKDPKVCERYISQGRKDFLDKKPCPYWIPAYQKIWQEGYNSNE